MITPSDIAKTGARAVIHLTASKLRKSGHPRVGVMLDTGSLVWLAYDVARKIESFVDWWQTPREHVYRLYWRHQCRHPRDYDGDIDEYAWVVEQGEEPIGEYRTTESNSTKRMADLQSFLDDLPGTEDILCF